MLKPLMVTANVRFRRVVMAMALMLYGVFLWLAWFDFPNPYADEAFFVPPAQTFASDFNFNSPSLDPHRALHWMPVGYAVLCGVFMKASGVAGLWGARLFSTVAFGLILWVLSRVGQRFNRFQYLALYVPFLTLPLLTLSRLGRMESLFLLVVLVSLWFMLRKRVVAACALTLMSCLIHPNGLYILLACLVLMVTQRRVSGQASGRRAAIHVAWSEWLLLALALATVGGYGLYEYLSIDSFLADMRYQFQRKARAPVLTAPLTWLSLVAVAVGALMSWLSPHREKLILTAWGSALILSRLIGQELWYSPGYIVGLTLILVALVQATATERTLFKVKGHAATPSGRSPIRAQALIATGVAAVMGGVFVLSAMVMGWHGGRIPLSTSGLPDNADQAQAIVARLRMLKAQTGASEVSCVPFEECMLLLDHAAEAGIVVRLNNPLTHPPIGRDCIWVYRANRVSSSDVDVRLDAGRITNFAIRPCGEGWPDVPAKADEKGLARIQDGSGGSGLGPT